VWRYSLSQRGSGLRDGPKARVVVEEIEVRRNGDVERFVATIDQQCAIGSDRIHAEIMLTRPPQLGGGTSPASCTP
jgi:hypothetical protein